jgi:hypothetical protein
MEQKDERAATTDTSAGAESAAMNSWAGTLEGGHQWPRAKSQAKPKETIRQHTPRNSGKSLSEIVSRLNRSLKGWRACFDQGRRYVYEDLDKMVRRRPRQILLKRRGKRGKPNGLINRKRPNAYFDKLGLWRLTGAPE